MASGKSGSFDLKSSNGIYTVRVNWSETYDPIANTSVVKITSVQVKSSNWYGVTYYPSGSIKINGSTVISMSSGSGSHNIGIWSQNTWCYLCNSSGSAVSASSSSISHNSDGSKSISISVSFTGYTSSGGYGSGWSVDGYSTISLTSIDRTAPTVSCAVTPLSSSSLKIDATANVNSDIWEYSLDDGSSWTQFSTTAGTSASVTVTGLSSAVYTVKARARKVSNHVYGTSSAATGDIVLPKISITASSITANSVYISAASDVNCNIWQYSIDNGETWTQFSSSDGTSATKTISGLTPNTSYPIKVRARKTSNSLYGTSGTTTIKTLGGTVINSVSDLAIDVSAPVLTLNWTIYDASYTHTLVIKNGNTVVLTVSNLTGSAGTNNKTYSFTAAERTAMLTAMANMASFTATFVVTTYSGTTQIGNASAASAVIKTTAENSAPTHGGFSCFDANATTVGITGNNAIYVQGQSSLQALFRGGTAKNGASISAYRITVGSKMVFSGSKKVSFGAISVAGQVTLTATVVDSRGWSVSQSVTLTVIEFSGISINSWSARRVNEVEDTSQIELAGTLSPIYVDDVQKNTLQSLRYRYKIVSATSWSDYYDISGVQAEDDKFYVDNDAFASFDAEYSWDIQICAADKLSTYVISIVLPKGKPLVAYRSKKVGINNNNPQSALDVSGEIMQNGYAVMGFVNTLNEYKTFNDVKSSGIYWYDSSAAASNAPSTEDGFLEVLCYGTAILQRFTGVSGAVVRRVYRTSWSAWA